MKRFSLSHFSYFSMICVMLVFLVGCDSDESPSELTCADWGYGADNGPTEWAVLCSATCGGTQQSPIDISTANTNDLELAAIEFDYHETEMELFNNGHTIEAADEHEQKTNTITVNGKTYELLQFHFHSVSEHTINGQHSPIEMHLVHRFSDTELAVIGVMINSGAENTALASVWNNLPPEEETPAAEIEVHTEDLLPESHEYYRYDGSLTTPNGSNPAASCAEIVNWIVMKDPIEMSPAQISAFQAIFDHNYRPTLSLNGRQVES
jgi:carbonic anhydrase